MNRNIAYGFLDESPSLSDTALFFCVDIISTNDRTNKRLQNIIKRTRKRTVNKKLKPLSEIKFNNSDDRTRMYVLSQIAKEDIEIVAIAINKEGRRVQDTPQNYGIAVGVIIAETASLYPLLNLTVDKKFTSRNQEQEFIAEAQRVAQILTRGNLNISFNPPADSKKESTVQLTDFIAGALNFKYNNRDDHYQVIITSKITVEKILRWTEIKKRIVKP